MNKLVIAVALLAGVLLFVAGGMYAALPAHSLPSYFPGYAPLTKHHYTHAVAAFGLGILCFVFVWFQSGKKSSK